jgi:hypothetical protein
MESVTASTLGSAYDNRHGNANGNSHGNAEANGNGSAHDAVELHDLWRVWVTPSDRKRCTYVTRDERPLAGAGSADRA